MKTIQPAKLCGYQVQFPWKQYLKQRLFDARSPVCWHPFIFWQQYRNQFLEDCWEFNPIERLESCWHTPGSLEDGEFK